MKTINPREGHKDLIRIINDNFAELAAKPKQVNSLVLIVTNWILVSDLYEYTIENPNILATSIVDVIPDNDSIAIVQAAEILPETISAAGSVKVYANNLPSANIGITINIF